MLECPPEKVEAWLQSQLKAAVKAANERGVPGGLNNLPIEFDIPVQVDTLAYQRVIEAYARSNTSGASQKAEYWIGRLERHYDAAVQVYNAKYGVSDDSVASTEDTNGIVDGEGTARTKTSAFAALVASRKAAPPNATTEQSSTNMQRVKHAAIVRSVQPTVDCYNAVIEAWANDKDLISVVRSRRWLSKLEDASKDAPTPLSSSLQPNARSYDLYLHSCSRGIGKQHKQYRHRAEEAEDILRYRMSPNAPLSIRPTTESFNFVIRSWTRCRKELEVATKVMALVREMEGIQRDALLKQEKSGRKKKHADDIWRWKLGVVPNTKTYTMAMDAWIIAAGCKASKWSSEQRSLNNTYNQRARGREENGRGQSTMSPASTSNDDGTEEMENAESILKYIQTLEEIGRTDVRATVIAYNTLLSGWARLATTLRPNVPLKAEELLHQMMQLSENGDIDAAPDATSFNAVIKAWGNTQRPNSASRCEWWLRKMINEQQINIHGERSSVPPPNVQTYNLVMEAWLKLGDPSRVQDLLLEMDASSDVAANSESFSKVIRAWLQEELSNTNQYGLPGTSLENAFNWLQELMEREKTNKSDLGSSPDLYKAILKTAARTDATSKNILVVGQAAFWDMRDSRFGIDAQAYEWLLEIGAKVLGPHDTKKRDDFVSSLVQQCCNDGYLSAKFINKLANPSHYKPIQESDGVELALLLGEPPYPTSWSRNLVDKR